MSETDKPQPQPDQPPQATPPPPDQGRAAPEEQPEAPAQPDQPAPEPPPQEQTVQAPPAQPVAVAKRPPRTLTMRTWVAAGIGALLLIGAGLGGYFIGAANDNDHNRDRPGATRFDHRPGPGPRDFPRFRDGAPNRGGTPG